MTAGIILSAFRSVGFLLGDQLYKAKETRERDIFGRDCRGRSEAIFNYFTPRLLQMA